MTFGNRSVLVHLLRGAAGFGALGLALAAGLPAWASLALVPAAMVALKGCPVCWTVGLMETLALRVHAGSARE